MKTVISQLFQSIGLVGASTAIAFVFSQNALAARLIVTGNGVVTGIEELEIGGLYYDVEFKWANFDDIYDINNHDSLPKFWGDETGAEIAAEAIGTALGSDRQTSGLLLNKDDFVIATGITNDGDTVTGWGDLEYGSLINDRYGSTLDFRWDSFGLRNFAVLKEAGVENINIASTPEPASTIAILAVVATGLLFTRKHKKN